MSKLPQKDPLMTLQGHVDWLAYHKSGLMPRMAKAYHKNALFRLRVPVGLAPHLSTYTSEKHKRMCMLYDRYLALDNYANVSRVARTVCDPSMTQKDVKMDISAMLEKFNKWYTQYAQEFQGLEVYKSVADCVNVVMYSVQIAECFLPSIQDKELDGGSSVCGIASEPETDRFLSMAAYVDQMLMFVGVCMQLSKTEWQRVQRIASNLVDEADGKALAESKKDE